MKTFKWYDITCALTHDIETCEHCRKCGDDGAKIRAEMIEYVKALDNGFDKACEIITNWERDYKDSGLYDKQLWKEYLLQEGE